MEHSQDKRSTNHLRLPSVTELVQTFRISDTKHPNTSQNEAFSRRPMGPNVSIKDSPRSFATPDIANNNSPRGLSDYYYSRRYSSSDVQPFDYRYQQINPALQLEPNIPHEGGSQPVLTSPLTNNDSLYDSLVFALGSLEEQEQRSREIENDLKGLYQNLMKATSDITGRTNINYSFHHNFSPKQKMINPKETILSIPESDLNVLIMHYSKGIKSVNKIKSLRKILDSQPSNHPTIEKVKKNKQAPRRKSIHTISRKNIPSPSNPTKSLQKVKPNKPNFINVENRSSTTSAPLSFRGGLNEGLCIRNETTCEQCESKTTPEWRRGPNGSRTLCNACGLYYSKLIKKFDLKEADRIMKEKKEKGLVGDRRLL